MRRKCFLCDTKYKLFINDVNDPDFKNYRTLNCLKCNSFQYYNRTGTIIEKFKYSVKINSKIYNLSVHIDYNNKTTRFNLYPYNFNDFKIYSFTVNFAKVLNKEEVKDMIDNHMTFQ